MPRPLTLSDRNYLAELALRNIREDPEDTEAGQETPMAAIERMKRKRIRGKSEKAIRDLLLAETAGVIDVTELLEEAKSTQEETLSEYNIDGESSLGDGEEEELFHQLVGHPPEHLPEEM